MKIRLFFANTDLFYFLPKNISKDTVYVILTSCVGIVAVKEYSKCKIFKQNILGRPPQKKLFVPVLHHVAKYFFDKG